MSFVEGVLWNGGIVFIKIAHYFVQASLAVIFDRQGEAAVAGDGRYGGLDATQAFSWQFSTI